MSAGGVRFRVAADYNCFAVWAMRRDDRPSNVDPSALGVPGGLVDGLTAWATAYDRTLNEDYPPDSGFESQEAHALFSQWGATLAAWLASALGEPVEYFDDQTGESIAIEPQ